MLYKLQAIVLHTLKYGESSLIVHAYTNIFGRQSFLLHGVRKKHSKINSNFFQPLSLIEIDAYYKENREIQRIHDVKTISNLYHSHLDIRRNAIALFLSEFLYKCLREVEPNKKLFDYLSHALQILEITDEGIENFHLIFLLQLTKFIGIFPGEKFLQSGFREEINIDLRNLLDTSLTEITKIKLSSSLRIELLKQIVEYYRSQLEGIGNINSLRILREVFH